MHAARTIFRNGTAGFKLPVMPRLVSLTLLSMLVLPAGALVYTLAVVLGFELLGWQYEDQVFLIADVITFGLVIGWWSLLWGPKVDWSNNRLSWTVAATIGSVVLGALCGAATALADVGGGFPEFVGGIAAMIAWLVSACILWRDRTMSSSSGGPAVDLITCPKCGYSLNGLHEARCPECGQTYTLDVLLLAQPAMRNQADLAERP